MVISKLNINGVRNLERVGLYLSERFNLLEGENGSGKTSVLEALSLLGRGRSFRSSHWGSIVQHGHTTCSVHATLLENDVGCTVAIERDEVKKKLRIRCGQEQLPSAVDLVSRLPMQVLHPGSFQLLSGAPQLRRQWLDWGVFYQEGREFFSVWQRYRKLLKQRNHLLRNGQRAQREVLSALEKGMVQTASQLHQWRLCYTEKIIPYFKSILSCLLPQYQGDIILSYSPGWDTQVSYSDILLNALDRDFAVRYTQYGPHRANIKIQVGSAPAHEILSRGQQKIVVASLRLAQGALLNAQEDKQKSIYLLDDFPSELDEKRRDDVLDVLDGLKSQVFLSGVQYSKKNITYCLSRNAKMFHVKHGRVEEQ